MTCGHMHTQTTHLMSVISPQDCDSQIPLFLILSSVPSSVLSAPSVRTHSPVRGPPGEEHCWYSVQNRVPFHMGTSQDNICTAYHHMSGKHIHACTHVCVHEHM